MGILILRNRLKYALNGAETNAILQQRLIKVDGKVKVDKTYPCGFMDVLDIDKTDEHFRLIYDSKGRFVMHRITKEESSYKLCKVRQMKLGDKKIPHIVTHDGRTIRYPDPMVKELDSVVVDVATNKIKDYIKFDSGNVCMIGKGNKPMISLPKGKGIKLSILEEAA